MLFPLVLGFLLSSRQSTRHPCALSAIKLRRAELDDVRAIELLAVDVFGESDNTGFRWLSNQVLRFQILLGFNARISACAACDFVDYNVFCLIDDDEQAAENDQFFGLRGIIELSVQPTNGERAGMMPSNLDVKKRASKGDLRPYISNLVVDRRFRRRGFAKQLVQVCEDTAVSWGYRECFLHVDMEEKPALALYDKVGYHTVKEDPPWMKIFSGVQLRYMSRRVTPT